MRPGQVQQTRDFIMHNEEERIGYAFGEYMKSGKCPRSGDVSNVITLFELSPECADYINNTKACAYEDCEYYLLHEEDIRRVEAIAKYNNRIERHDYVPQNGDELFENSAEFLNYEHCESSYVTNDVNLYDGLVRSFRQLKGEGGNGGYESEFIFFFKKTLTKLIKDNP